MRLLAIFVCVLPASLAVAEPARLSDDAIKETLAGAALEFDSPLGITVPVRFGTDGLVSGETTALAAVLGAAKDRGRWWVKDGKLCSKWFRWFDAEVRCAVVSSEGDRMFFASDDGKNGTATIVERPKPPQQTSKSVVAQAEVAAPVAPKPVEVKPEETRAPETKPDEARPVVTAEVAPPPAVSPPPRVLNAFASLAASPAEAAQPPAPVTVAPADKPVSDVKEREPAKAVTAEQSPTRTAALVAKPIKGAVKSASEARKNLASTGAAKAKVKNENTRISASEVKKLPKYRVARVEEDDILNVRDGPSAEHETIAEIPPNGRNVAMTGPCEQDWCPVRYAGAKGWVHRYYLVEDVADAAKRR